MIKCVMHYVEMKGKTLSPVSFAFYSFRKSGYNLLWDERHFFYLILIFCHVAIFF
jgi:hypothetical protein